MLNVYTVHGSRLACLFAMSNDPRQSLYLFILVSIHQPSQNGTCVAVKVVARPALVPCIFLLSLISCMNESHFNYLENKNIVLAEFVLSL